MQRRREEESFDRGNSFADSDDDKQLESMGYKPQLFRGLSAFMNFAFGVTEVAVLVSLTIVFGFGLATGGPVVMLWGFLLTFAATTVIAFCMAEICGAYPRAGSVYIWAGQLAPEKSSSLWSYICGWFNFLGNAAGDAAFASGFANFLSSAVVASELGEAFSVGTQVWISAVVLFVWSGLNCFRVDQIGWLNSLAAFCQLGAVIVIVIVLCALPSKHSDATFVFTDYENETGFASVLYVSILGLATSLFGFVGYEASAHMAEETSNSSTAASYGIIYTVLATGTLGIILLVAMLFAVTDVGAVLNGNDQVNTGNVAANVFILACGRRWGATLVWFVLVNFFFAGLSSVAVTGRITYALARDMAFPFSEILAEVNPTLNSPIYAIFFIFFIDCALQLLPLVNDFGETAYLNIIGLSSIGFQVSYGIPIFLKVVYNPPDFPLTPMSLGEWSTPMGIVSFSWLFGTSIIFLLPTSSPVTADNMNWLIVVFAIVVLIGTLNWIFNSSYYFKGPQRSGQSRIKEERQSLLSE